MKLGNGLISPWRHLGWYLVCGAVAFGVLAGCRGQPGPTSTPVGTAALTQGSPATHSSPATATAPTRPPFSPGWDRRPSPGAGGLGGPGGRGRGGPPPRPHPPPRPSRWLSP